MCALKDKSIAKEVTINLRKNLRAKILCFINKLMACKNAGQALLKQQDRRKTMLGQAPNNALTTNKRL